MAINKSYVRPHTEVYQFLDKTVASTGDHLTACIIGALYDLYRYGKEVTEGSAPVLENTKISVDYNYNTDNPLYSDYIVDHESALLVAENILLADTTYVSTTENVKLKVSLDELGICRFVKEQELEGETVLVPVIVNGEDASGCFATRPVVVGDVLLLGSNDKYSFTVKKLVSTKEDGLHGFDGVELDNLPVLSGSSTTYDLSELCILYSGTITDVEVDDVNKKMRTSQSVKLLETGPTYKIQEGFGKLYPEFRVMLGGYEDEDIHVIGSVSEIQNQLGTIDVWNELAYAAYCALKGSQGRDIYAIRVPSDDLEGYRIALRKTDADTFPYSFVPIVDGSRAIDQDIVKLVVNYCNEKSDPEVQMWRQTIAGIDSPREYEVRFIDLPAAEVKVQSTALIDGTKNLIQLNTSQDRKNYSFRRISINGGEGSLATGDIITVYTSTGATTGTDYTVIRIVSDNVVQVKETVTAGTCYITMTKANTSKNHMAYLHGLSQQIGNRRGVLVWCDGGVYNGKSVKSAYLAAEVAGLCSSVLPQQSITMTEIQSISSCSNMYLNYTLRELDNIASGGILIITQDNKYGTPYIRHQLTTDATHGSLYSEMSITRNLDNISYGVADIIRGYCGRANVTTTSLPHLRAALLDRLTRYTQDSVSDLIGPSLVRFYDLTVQQDTEHKDMIIVNVTYELPLPMNIIKVYQMVYAATIRMDDVD